MKKRILVTGGAGFLGMNLCKRLLDAGHTVIAVDNFITSTGENLTHLSVYPRFSFFKWDITNPFSPEMEKKIGQIDFIFHLACPTGVSNLIPLAEEMILTSSIGTRNILQLAQKTKAVVVYASSSEVYGQPEQFPQREEYTGNVSPLGERSPYEEGKRIGESLCFVYSYKFGVDVKIVRIFNTFGPGMNLLDTRIMSSFLKNIKEGKPLPVQGDGSQTRTFCFVDDLVEGLLVVSEKGEKGEVYNLGSDREMTILALAESFLHFTNMKNGISFVGRPAHDHNRRVPDLSKIRSLGWDMQYDLEDGIKKTMVWYG